MGWAKGELLCGIAGAPVGFAGASGISDLRVFWFQAIFGVIGHRARKTPAAAYLSANDRRR
jgi:hypothetical protein